MKTKISILTLFACAAAGTMLFADKENYDGQTIAAGTSFGEMSLVDSSWIAAIIGDSSGRVDFYGANLSGANFTRAEIIKSGFNTSVTTYVTVDSGGNIIDQYTRSLTTNLSNALFTGATITESSFSGAILTAADFENAVVGDSSVWIDFQGAELADANFTNATITNVGFGTSSSFGATNLSNATFSGATITASSFNGATLTDANFENAVVGDSSEDVRFHGADLTGANFTRAKISNTYFDPSRRSSISYDSSGNLFGYSFSDASATTNLSNATFSGATITASSFLNVVLVNANFENAIVGDSLVHVYFHGADLVGANFTSAKITNAGFSSLVPGSTTNLSNALFTGATITNSSFSEANLIGARFDSATITDSKFSGATLTDANFENAVIGDSSGKVSFQGADLTDANFTNAEITSSNFNSSNTTNITRDSEGNIVDQYTYSLTTNLSGGLFTGATITDSTFSGATLTGANFKNAKITKVGFDASASYGTTNLLSATFSGVTITDSSFSGASLTGANFDFATLVNAELRSATLTGANFENAVIGDSSGEVRFHGSDLTGANFTGAEITRTYFDPSTFSHVAYDSSGNITSYSFSDASATTNLSDALFTGATITSSSFLNVVLVNANFENALVGDSSGRVYFHGADLTGVNFTGATITRAGFSSLVSSGATNLSNALFTGATIADSSFSGAILTNADFTDANLTSADLFYATLTGANFEGAVIGDSSGEVQFRGADLADVNFTGAKITRTYFDPSTFSHVAYDSSGNIRDYSFSDASATTNLSNALFTGATITDSSFLGVVLTNANFENALIGDSSGHVYFHGADLTGANFTNAEITKAGFSSPVSSSATNLSNALFTGATITDTSFSGATLTNANFENATIVGDSSGAIRFHGADLTGVNFTRAKITSVYFDPSTLSYTARDSSGNLLDYSFSDASATMNLSNALFAGATITNSSFLNVVLVNADFENAIVGDSSGEVRFHGADLTGANFTGAKITKAGFSSIVSDATTNLSNAIFSGATITDSSFSGAILTNADLTNATLTNANFENAVITGADFSGSTLTWEQLCSTASYTEKDLSGIGLGSKDLSNKNFAGINLTNATFSNATLENTNFKGATLTNAKLDGSKLTNANLTNANLTTASLMSATLTGADLTNAVITGADFSGSTLTLEQLCSTASYAESDLSGVVLASMDLSNGDFSGITFSRAKLTKASLRYATLTGADFTGADLSDADMSTAKLETADFTNAVITGAKFSGSTLTLEQLCSTASYAESDLSGVGLASMDLSEGDFTGFNLTGVTFVGATLKNTDFTGADLTKASLWYATLAGADLTNAVITGANFSNSTLTLEQLCSTASYAESDLSGVGLASMDLSEGDFTGFNLTGVTFVGATLKNTDFTGADLSKASLGFATLTGADLTNAVITGADFSGSTLTLEQLCSTASYAESDLSGVDMANVDLSEGIFTGFNLTGATFVDATLKNTYFTGADLTNASLRYATLTGASFTGADLTNASLMCATLTGASFTGADLTNADLTNATLTNANFENAVITGADFSESTLTWGQLRSTASYKEKDLSGVGLASMDLRWRDFIGFNLAGTNLSNANLYGAKLSGADLSNATLHSARLSYADLSNANLSNANLSGADLIFTDLSNANLSNADLYGAELSVADLSNANLYGANLYGAHLCGANLYGAKLTNKNLTNADFARATLTNADLTNATLTNANFENAVITGADFSGSTLTWAQLSSTASYTEKDLSGVVGLASMYLRGVDFIGFNLARTNLSNADLYGAKLSGADLSNATLHSARLSYADLSNANLSNANLYGANLGSANLDDADLSNANLYGANLDDADLSNADLSSANFSKANLYRADLARARLSGADFTGATLLQTDFRGCDIADVASALQNAGTVKNVLGANGYIHGFTMERTGDRFVVSACVPAEGAEGIGAVVGSEEISGGAELWIGKGVSLSIEKSLAVCGESSLILGAGTELRFNWISDTSAYSQLSILDGGSLKFSSDTKIIIGASGVDSLFGSFTLITWADGSTMPDWSDLTKGGKIVLYSDAGVNRYADDAWEFSTDGNALTIKIYSGSVDPETEITINGIDQVINLPGTENVGTFDSALTEFRGTISGEGSIHSDDDLTFAGDASEHTGATYIDGGTFTIVDAAKLGTGAFEVASAKTLRIEGTRDFSNKLSGAGTMTTAGEITLSGNASGFTGATKVESGTLTIAESATLGTGAFEIAGTLALNGTRTFANETIGNGKIEVATGSTNFTKNVGVKTLSVSENATATLASGVGLTRADATVEVAGTLALNGSRTFANETSGNGKIDVSTGATTFTKNVGVKTLSVSRNATATLASGVGLTRTDANVEIAGTLALNGNNRTFANATSGDGKIEVATGSTNFTKNVGVKTLSVSENATATLASGIGLTHANASVAIDGTLVLNGNRTFANATSGNGKIEVATGSTNFTKNIGVKTLSVSENATAMLASGIGLTQTNANVEIAGTLALNGDRTFKNATSGNGTISVMTDADVSFTKNIGVKTLSVADGAKLRGNVKLTHGADAVLELAGTLVLDADAGEKVSLNGGEVVLASTAKLDLSGTSSAVPVSASVQALTATGGSALDSGARVTIFENGRVATGGLTFEEFLRTDSTLSDLATRYAVVYDTTGGLSVRVLSSDTADTSIVDTHGLSASFVGWAFEKAASASLPVGIRSVSDIPSADDPLVNALLSGDAGTARAILDRLSPKSYAAMIAMPVETFHNDVRSISARLEQRRYDATVRRGLSWEFFAQAQMISVDNDTLKSAPTFDFDRYGVLAGADVKLDPTTLVGIALGAGTGKAKIHNGGGKIESDDYRLNVFGGKTFAERFYVNAGAQLGFASYDVKRTTDYGNANASADGWNAGAFAETGAVLTISDAYKLYAMPYFGLAYTHAATDSFKESGSDDAAFDADSLAGDSLRARLGCSFSWRFDVAGARWRVGFDVAYSHELLDDEIDVDVKTTDDGSKISETAKALPKDVFSIGPSVNVDLTSSSSIYADYSFNAGTDSATAHNANVGFKMRF